MTHGAVAAQRLPLLAVLAVLVLVAVLAAMITMIMGPALAAAQVLQLAPAARLTLASSRIRSRRPPSLPPTGHLLPAPLALLPLLLGLGLVCLLVWLPTIPSTTHDEAVAQAVIRAVLVALVEGCCRRQQYAHSRHSRSSSRCGRLTHLRLPLTAHWQLLKPLSPTWAATLQQLQREVWLCRRRRSTQPTLPLQLPFACLPLQRCGRLQLSSRSRGRLARGCSTQGGL